MVENSLRTRRSWGIADILKTLQEKLIRQAATYFGRGNPYGPANEHVVYRHLYWFHAPWFLLRVYWRAANSSNLEGMANHLIGIIELGSDDRQTSFYFASFGVYCINTQNKHTYSNSAYKSSKAAAGMETGFLPCFPIFLFFYNYQIFIYTKLFNFIKFSE